MKTLKERGPTISSLLGLNFGFMDYHGILLRVFNNPSPINLTTSFAIPFAPTSWLVGVPGSEESQGGYLVHGESDPTILHILQVWVSLLVEGVKDPDSTFPGSPGEGHVGWCWSYQVDGNQKSWNHLFIGCPTIFRVLSIPGGCLGFLKHQQ